MPSKRRRKISKGVEKVGRDRRRTLDNIEFDRFLLVDTRRTCSDINCAAASTLYIAVAAGATLTLLLEALRSAYRSNILCVPVCVRTNHNDYMLHL